MGVQNERRFLAMKKLKKVLSLVLVLAMAVSMFGVVASAKDISEYPDVDKITYTEAVGVLSGLGVLQGDENGNFRPTATLMRSEAAKMLVYLVALQNNKVEDGTKFDDVVGHWAENDITIAESVGLVNGYGDGKFHPFDKLTGYMWEKMCLSALGYDAEIEGMLGEKWEGGVLTLADKLDLRAGLRGYDATKEITREQAAQIAFNALNNKTVTYPISGASHTIAIPGQKTLGELKFGLDSDSINDKWGRPGYAYTSYGRTIYSWMETPIAKFNTEKTECEIATAIGLQRTEKITDVWANGKEKAGTWNIEPTDTVGTYGHQGRQVEIYAGYRVVIIDTYLAKVNDVKDATFDEAGHKINDATITLGVYKTDKKDDETALTLTDAKNYTYAKGDYVLVNVHNDAAKSDILGVAETVEGEVTKYTSKTTTVGETTYDDAYKYNLGSNKAKEPSVFFLDQFKNVIGRVKIMPAAPDYGIIKDIQWINPESANGYAQATVLYMDGTEEKAVVAKIGDKKTEYAKAQEEGDPDQGTVSTTLQYNGKYFGKDLYKITASPDGLVMEAVTELTDATIVTGKSAITGTGDPDKVLTNSDTAYLIQTVTPKGPEYKFVTGYNNVPNYTASATVDYVEAPNGYAQFVYVTGKPDMAETKATGLFYPTDAEPEVSYVGNDTLYTYKGFVDGVEGTIVSKSEQTFTVTSLYKVEYTNGFVSQIKELKDNGAIKVFAGTKFVVDYPATPNVATIEVADVTADVLNGTADGAEIQVNVTDFTAQVGPMAPGKTVRVVYYNKGDQNYALEAYVID